MTSLPCESRNLVCLDCSPHGFLDCVRRRYHRAGKKGSKAAPADPCRLRSIDGQ
ncbi:hypothetical protein LEMLEM_LOCUS7508 [Lemmus lemmus]